MAVSAELICQCLDPCSPPGRWLSFLPPLPHFLCSPSATCGSWKWSDRAQQKGENTVCVSENVKGTILCILFHSWYSSLSPAELPWPTALRILLYKCCGDERKDKGWGVGGWWGEESDSYAAGMGNCLWYKLYFGWQGLTISLMLLPALRVHSLEAALSGSWWCSPV